ncbi:hypothetical protein FAUST_10297 [Fusarium austroamericanum]|uniref:Uncharacterized protein n=1 Tax=Fusarium austroamericanum TaxID=282268 RepID=A0AAN5Z1Y0_FUSAU|nr:hypothetical protein FAUST_10297 [Fusarium austroamericanum]
MASYVFDGVKRKTSNGEYYYLDDDMPTVRVPISNSCHGDRPMKPEELNEWFGVREDNMPSLPGYFTIPDLHSKHGGKSGKEKSYADYYFIEGAMVVYRPIEWVPSVVRIKTIPKNNIITTIKKEEVVDTRAKLYARAELSIELSAGGSGLGMAATATATSEIGVDFEKNTTKTETWTQEGQVGTKALNELAVGMLLKVEEVYRHSINVWVDGRKKGDSMGWSGGPGWNQIHVPETSLRSVRKLQFYNMRTSGVGGTQHLYIQTLPIFDKEKKLKDLHIALSNGGWEDWYAYVVGKKGESQGTKLLAYPGYQPSVTLMPA